jgi:E3 ubiquitin-protein ligase UBR2
MDKVTRQVGQHVEFDPEWETAFNLVIKIQSILSSILDWCSHDVNKKKEKMILYRILFLLLGRIITSCI